MASPLAVAMMGGNDAGMLGVDPAVMQAMPDLQLAQALMQGGISTAPASPMQALARIAQTGAGRLIQTDATSQLAQAYAGSAENMAQALEKTAPGSALIPALRSPDPTVRMLALQQAGKVLTLTSEPQRAGPTTTITAGNQPMAQGNPRLAGAVAAQEAPYREGGDITVNTPQGPTKVPITAASRAAMQPNAGPPSGPPRVPATSAPSAAIQPPQPGAPQPGAPQPGAPQPPPPAPGSTKYQSRVGSILPGGAQILASEPQIAQAKETSEAAAKDYAEKSTPTYNSAQALVGRLDIIDHNIQALGPSWMGSGANAKAELAKAFNSTLQTFGVDPQKYGVDPTKVGTWEDFNKETVRAGMELIKSNFGGSREAASIIQMGTTAVPSVQNSYLGAKYVSATIRAAAQREIDLHEYKTQLLQQGKSLVGADVDFSKQHPPQGYALGAITSQIPPSAVAHLKANPQLAPQFDQQFGSKTAEFILGQR